jgi:hypothetical protein
VTTVSVGPSLGLVWDYLLLTGWSVESEGVAGTLVAKGDVRIGVPRKSDNVLLSGVITRIAEAEGRPYGAVAQQIRYLHFDVAYLRAANDYRIADTIPLEVAAKIITSARTMLRSTATTARGLRGQIGTYSSVGDEVVKETLMGHTEKGSFVIPVLVPIPAPKNVEPHVDVGQPTIAELDVHRTAPEPFERRVTRTFAQSMGAMQALVIGPAKTPTRDQVHELVYRGVSREFCVALVNILEQSAVAEFGATVQWTPTVPVPNTLASDVTIDADAVGLVTKVASQLRRSKIEPSSVFTGTIVELRHVEPDPFGEIAVSTVRRGHQSEIRVRLPFDHYAQAWEWHRAGQSVLVEGKVRRSPGKRLMVDSPRRCEPVEATHLPDLG